MKLTSCRSTFTPFVRPGGPGPLNSNSIFCSMSIFLNYFERKNWRGGDELLLENGTLGGYAY